MSKRDAYFDNARFLLILLVVFGHLISPLKDDSNLLSGLYKFIFLFHMPGFILISGFFAKGFNRPGYLVKIFKKTLIPYAIFQIIYCFFYYVTGYESHFSLSLFDPHWTLWFLMSLFCWNVLLKLFADKPYALPVAIVLGIAVGYIPFFGSYLSIERTFTFFPIFLLGYMLNKGQFQALRQLKYKFLALPVLAAVFITCYMFFPDSFTGWLLCSHSYADLGYAWTGGAIRALFYLATFITMFSFLALVPSQHRSFTKLGTQTLYIYLLHGFFVKLIGLNSYYQHLNDILQYIVLFLASIALCYILGSEPVRRFAQPFIEIKPPNALKHKTSAPRFY